MGRKKKMNALNVIGVASNLSFFVIVIAGILATLEDTKINSLQMLFYILLEMVFGLNIFLICTR